MTSLYQTAQEPRPVPTPGTALKYFDVVVVALAAIPALALGAPVLGYVLGGGMWIVQRVIQANDSRLWSRFSEPRQLLAARLWEAFGRIWLLAIAIIVAGVAGGRADGLTAAVVVFGAYSIAFAIRLFTGPSTPPMTRGPRR
jgi:hypothetical protein